MKTPQLKTFTALADYARERAKKSAERNDPIAWAYWKETAAWAKDKDERPGGSDLERALKELDGLESWINDRGRLEEGEFMETALAYSHMKWCVAILRANGRKWRLSLDWMRKQEGGGA